MKKNLFWGILITLVISLNGCGDSSSTTNTYEKKNQSLSIETEPESYRKYALVSNGAIEVKKTLSTDGPLADVHANGEIKARSLSLDISGKITSENDLSGSIVRSFDYESPLGNSDFVNIRALKVDEYLNTNDLEEYYLLTKDGKALHKIKDEDDKTLNIKDVQFIFENGVWSIKGESSMIQQPLIVESDLNIETDYLFITNTLMVQGNLTSKGELNINTGTPFDKALIVDNNIEVDKLVAIGRIHGSGTFTSHKEVNILGNAEIDGDVTLYGDAKINFLDNVYKSALYEAQLEATENNTSLMLAHSQLFSDVKGKNSVVLFTFVEGNYILNEETINQLIETNQTNDFKFKSSLYGATLNYGAELQKFDGLSPYYKNKLAIVKKLNALGHQDVRISESLDIAPSNLYHTFKDKNGTIIGTYQVYSLSNAFDENNLTILTQEQRDDAIYQIDNKDEIEAEQETQAKEKQEEQKQSIIDNNDLNLTTKSEMLNEIEASENNESTIDKVALKEEATQDRVQEWVEYKDLASDKVELDVQNVAVEEATQARGWFSRVTRAVRRVFRRVTFQECKTKYEYRRITGVNSDYYNTWWDTWSRNIQLDNANYEYCVPLSASMILNYHRWRKGRSLLYSTSRHARLNANSSYVRKIVNAFNTSATKGTDWSKLYWTVPRTISTELWRNGTPGYSYSYYTAFWNRAWQHYLVKYYIQRNNPVMFTAWQNHGSLRTGSGRYQSTGDHTMPVIGYKRQYYKGWCWKRIMPEKKWILVDTTWRSRGYIRFDMRSNYWKIGTMTYVRSW